MKRDCGNFGWCGTPGRCTRHKEPEPVASQVREPELRCTFCGGEWVPASDGRCAVCRRDGMPQSLTPTPVIREEFPVAAEVIRTHFQTRESELLARAIAHIEILAEHMPDLLERIGYQDEEGVIAEALAFAAEAKALTPTPVEAGSGEIEAAVAAIRATDMGQALLTWFSSAQVREIARAAISALSRSPVTKDGIEAAAKICADRALAESVKADNIARRNGPRYRQRAHREAANALLNAERDILAIRQLKAPE